MVRKEMSDPEDRMDYPVNRESRGNLDHSESQDPRATGAIKDPGVTKEPEDNPERRDRPGPSDHPVPRECQDWLDFQGQRVHQGRPGRQDPRARVRW